MQKNKIYIVDDDPAFLEFLTEVLKEEYSVTAISSGQETIVECKKQLPDIVLLDIGLQDTSGFDICLNIKEIDIEDNCSVIFVSGRDTLEERIKGYTVGADDFIAKPLSVHELLAKVNKISHFQQQNKNLSEQEKLARNIAFQAMTEASQYGYLIQFIKAVLGCQDLDDVIKSITEVTQSFSLNCCIQMRGGNDISLRSNGNPCSPIEKDLFNLLKDNGRIYSFNNRSMFNGLNISILITNMPDNEVYYGQIKDLLAVVIEVVESVIININRKNALELSLNGLDKTLGIVLDQFEKQKTHMKDIMGNYVRDIEENLLALGLTEEQEQFFIKRAENTEHELL